MNIPMNLKILAQLQYSKGTRLCEEFLHSALWCIKREITADRF